MVRASDVLLIIVSHRSLLFAPARGRGTHVHGKVAILFPPAAAAFITGCSCDLLINICLTMYVRLS